MNEGVELTEMVEICNEKEKRKKKEKKNPKEECTCDGGIGILLKP